ncbi:hypothetical protein Cgig2_009939 [Carnegiea gigantea]|uniref:CASP-like protein n=1 Tax=Carnegiea gigantea TaxID=171969 RepID=A0A9Q1K043_9CARY|nr:hypothetical protein Cgig2_009939 [Carnegiea gigantea]
MGEVVSEVKSPAADSPAPGVEMVTIVSSSLFACRSSCRKVWAAVHVILRVLCLLSSVVSLCVMVTAEQSSTLSLFGFQLPVYSKWSFSDSFQYSLSLHLSIFMVDLIVCILDIPKDIGIYDDIATWNLDCINAHVDDFCVLPLYCGLVYATLCRYLVGVSAAVAAHSSLQLLISVSRLRRKVSAVPSPSYAWLLYAGDKVFAYATMSAGSAASGVTSLNRTGIRHSSLPNFCKPLQTLCNRVGISIAFTFFSCFLLAASTVLDVIWLNCF